MTPGESAESNPMPIIALDRYASLPTGELVLFAVQHLHADGVPATLEEIVSTCFKLFPHRFALKNYFYWPDSAQVVQALNDAKEKGYIKESLADGFVVRPAGRQVAKQAARAMGVPMPMPPRVEKPKPAEPQPEPESVAPPEPPKEATLPVNINKRRKRAAMVKKKTEEKAKPKPKKPKPVKQKTAAKPKPPAKKAVRKKAKVEKAVLPAKKKAERIRKRKTRGAKRKPALRKVKGTQTARQLPLQFPTPAKPKPPKKVAAKKPAKPKPSKKISVKKPARAKISKPAAPSVSREEKIKAGKFIHLMERSDAYRQYKKLGRKARISEFDFRNMLFATMESSAETLKRNVELYKRYAGIHNRADLIAFLDFTEGSFAPLLRTQAKQPRRKR